MTRPSRVVIDKQALQHNLQRVRELAPKSKIMAIVKADAYGHGLIRVAQTLHDADAFGVACLEEAEQLRAASIKNPIVLLEGPHKANDLSRIVELQLDIVIHNESQLQILEQANLDEPLQVWLKIDTGMHRLGFPVDKVNEALERLSNCSNVKPAPKLMTHFAVANDKNNPLTQQQLELFNQLSKNSEAEKTISNSAAIINYPETHVDWIRPGLMLYGVSPMKEGRADEHGLKPVMTLESELISIQQLSKNDTVGYGATWKCPEDMPVGVIAAGYGDGFPRHAKSGTPILVNDVRCSLIGRASMDMLTVDLRNQPEARIGDRVVLWGESLPIEEIAQYAETIPYELMCGVHKRLEFFEQD
ncbi:MAG TPA: alanine racemase [Thiotrichaceae bacterium]|jgi:alanine racemase|nr:alanine racemase [Thiotrichaceae bacterium]HIM08469.1 alanine racemase [Gammaproteobacteria bacterium]